MTARSSGSTCLCLVKNRFLGMSCLGGSCRGGTDTGDAAVQLGTGLHLSAPPDEHVTEHSALPDRATSSDDDWSGESRFGPHRAAIPDVDRRFHLHLFP